jgi:hypothetical protein
VQTLTNMDQTPSSALSTLAAFRNEAIWQRLEGIITAATSWHLLLVDRGGCLVDPGPGGGEEALSTVAAEPLRDLPARETVYAAIA